MFSPKTPSQEALCVKARHGAGPTCRRAIMASHSEPAVSDVQKLEDTTFGWQSDQVSQTVGASTIPLFATV
jgi:hypothetical protein